MLSVASQESNDCAEHSADTAGGEPASGSGSGSGSLIDTIVREGAQRMLAAAVQAEVDAYVGQFSHPAEPSHGRLKASHP